MTANPNERIFFDEKYGMTYNGKCDVCGAEIFIPERSGQTIYEGKEFYHNRLDKVVGVIGKIINGMKYEVLCFNCSHERSVK